MADLESEVIVATEENETAIREDTWDERIMIIAGGSDDDDGDYDDFADHGEDDHNLSNQDPDSDD